MAALTDWLHEGLARGFGVADHRLTPRRRPPVPRHVETFTVDPPRVRTSPVVRVEVPEPEEDEVEVVVEPVQLPAVLSILVGSNADRADLVRDQAEPPRFVVLDPAGGELARFHGCEHATKFARLTGPNTVMRIEDGAAMTNVVARKGRP